MSIIATLQDMDGDKKVGKEYDIEFDTEDLMRYWLEGQEDHPWLSINVIKVRDNPLLKKKGKTTWNDPVVYCPYIPKFLKEEK